jgi:hypothetical protein
MRVTPIVSLPAARHLQLLACFFGISGRTVTTATPGTLRITDTFSQRASARSPIGKEQGRVCAPPRFAVHRRARKNRTDARLRLHHDCDITLSGRPARPGGRL